MGFFESINRAFFNLTYNEKASKAYDEQNEKAADAVEGIKKQIQDYRDTREKIIGANEASEYFSSNALAKITEWDNWIQKNAGLPAGDYSKKSTEMKTQWESLINVNKMVKEMSRVGPFIDLYIKDKDTKLPTQQKSELEKLRDDANKYYENIKNKTPADIVAKRDEYNTRFEAIQKKIPENFEDLKEPFEDTQAPPNNLVQGTEEERFNAYRSQVEERDLANENTFQFSRLFSRAITYAFQGFKIVYPFFFGIIFAMIIANDAIGRPAMYRIFYFVYMFILFNYSFIPGFWILIILYYLYRAFKAINWGNLFSFQPEGPRMDYLLAPVLFAFLPIFESKPGEVVPWYYSIFKYDVNAYDGLARKKKMAYEINAARLVGKTLDPALYGLDDKSFNQVLCDLKSVLINEPTNAMEEALNNVKAIL